MTIIRVKFDYGYFIIFLQYGSKILHKKSQVISTKNEGVTAILPNFDFHFESGKSMSCLYFWSKLLEFFVQNFRTITQKSYKILHKKFQVILSKNEGMTLIFLIQNEIKTRENHRHAFNFG